MAPPREEQVSRQDFVGPRKRKTDFQIEVVSDPEYDCTKPDRPM